ncbi:MAG: Fic family protein [Candidatus Moranbacteria bacterium]|nr:Fic family protein [Candidatus Moranbacteria bacterium]
MKFNKNKPYNSLPLLPPKKDLETKEVLKKVILAREALGKLVASNKRLPNEYLFINSIIIQEAKQSSEIENIVTTNDELYQSLSSNDLQITPEVKEVLAYSKALWKGYNDIKKKGFLNTNSFIEIASIIKGDKGGIRKLSGTKLMNPITNKVIYTPPEGENVIREKLKNLENFINDKKDSLEPLIKMAIIHYQFESIHPFYDGNGRTGRILNILYLILNDLLDKPILYLSQYIIENKNNYYKNLRLVSEKGDWESWVLFVIEAVKETAKYTEQKINKIINLMNSTGERINKELPTIYSQELVEILFQLPYTKRKFLVKAKIAQKKTAGKYLNQLEKIGILKSTKKGREKLYLNKRFYQLLKK